VNSCSISSLKLPMSWATALIFVFMNNSPYSFPRAGCALLRRSKRPPVSA
jgi:hypothetical protein